MVDVRGKTSFAFSTLFMNKEDIPQDYKKKMKERISEISKAIENPNEIIEEAIIQCFSLFNIPKKDYKKFISEDGEVEFRNKSRILNISYKKVKNSEEFKLILDKINQIEKIHAYKVDWVIFNVTWDIWSENIRKIYEHIIKKSLKVRIPGLGSLLGDFINKKIKETGDQWIVKDINEEFNEIFFSILKTNPVIDYIKYGNKKILKTRDINQNR